MTEYTFINFLLYCLGGSLLTLFLKKSATILTKHFYSALYIRTAIGLLAMPIIGTLALCFGVWVFTDLTLWPLYTLYFSAMSVGALLILFLQWRAGLVSNEVVIMTTVAELVTIARHRTSAKFSQVVFRIYSFLLFGALPFVLFVLDMRGHELAIFLFIWSLASAMLYNLLQLFVRLPLMFSSGLLDHERNDFFISSSFSLYVVALVLYAIVAALEWPLFPPLFTIFGVNINMIAIIALTVSSCLTFFLLAPYGFGLSKRNNLSRLSIEKRLELVGEIEKATDSSDVQKSLSELSAIRSDIAQEKQRLEGEVTKQKELYLEAANSVKGVLGNEINVGAIIERVLSLCIDEIESYRSYLERIDIVITNSSSGEVSRLDSLTYEWKRILREADVKPSNEFPYKVMSAVSLVWVVVSAVFGIEIADILKWAGVYVGD